jgi:hypothetical protein
MNVKIDILRLKKLTNSFSNILQIIPSTSILTTFFLTSIFILKSRLCRERKLSTCYRSLKPDLQIDKTFYFSRKRSLNRDQNLQQYTLAI